ncbi:hypothetical protein BKK79_25860 [Cupriavidus sp. USMAA2-4]|nr:hypothetical protein BKK79_25860 [Cupriavidus sp. USMAA2-4]
MPSSPCWFGLGVPAGVPGPILDQLNQAVRQVLAGPDVVAAIEKQGALPSPTSRAEFAELVHTENARWRKIVEDIHFAKLQ